MSSDRMKVISLGWGTQSFALAAMSALGEIEKVDFTIHADTTHERSDTYAFAERYTPWLEKLGVQVVTVSDHEQAQTVETYKTDIPAFTLSPKGRGMLRRQCTGRWKIVPMRRYLQKVRNKQRIEQWIGITTDEATRMKPSDVKYITHRWPLIELDMSRKDCISWLQNHGLDIPPRSACVFCPYHDANEWRDLKVNGNGDFQKAIRVDRAIRKVRPPYDLFVHQTCVPLEVVDFRTEVEKGQMTLWDEECEGMCGV